MKFATKSLYAQVLVWLMWVIVLLVFIRTPEGAPATVGRIEALPVPRTRKGYTQLFQRYQRRRTELDAAIGEMFIRGVSTRGVGEVFESLTGLNPSPSTVSRIFHTLEEEYETWKARPLAERYEYAFADGLYFTVIYDHEGCKMPILAIVGIRPDGQREVPAFTVGDRENQTAWEGLFEHSKQRGVKEIGLWTTDGNQAMLNALEAKFPGVPRQDGKRPELHPQDTAPDREAGAQGHLLPGQSSTGRSGRSRFL
ncbi:MAG: transposase [Anaerolineae bacterium]|jgi:transposase-like protein|nr:transposase [Anaerolineae bacterium]MDH7473381.1 transposase [Anaerolineae bacterium]